MTKSPRPVTLIESEKGQISIFFSASLIVLVSIVAFVINIGLFVKAKINLHNATDAAAFAGASVQARQLTKIAYLNWEMRNIFKEWMYKYYVVGNLNVSGTTNYVGDTMNFRLDKDENVITNVNSPDPFNIPAVCIHIAGSQTNVCKRFAVPGLPEFGGYNLPGAEEASRAFIDSLIGAKINDCVERSKLNMYVASTWAYNVMAINPGANPMSSGGPAILADRQGAWPKAIELAMRIRNLERVVNREAASDGICSQKSSTGNITCGRTIKDVEQEAYMGNERIIKAFYSGYRNLTTSHTLNGSPEDDEMKATFTLKELAPAKKPQGNPDNNSNFLIPQPYEKQWLDLKLMMVNYATFFAALIPRADRAVSGACDVSKIAIPVPGYPLGFYKNSDVVTYYAVKGEAEFLGMFNPFNTEAIKLTAYSAAKPFGGRIGPMLFYQKEGDGYVRGRTDTEKPRSVPYLISLITRDTPIRMPRYKDANGNTVPEQMINLAAGKYAPGAPLPINFSDSNPFWILDPSQPVGGKDNNGQVYFGIPNLVYEFPPGSNMSPVSYSGGGAALARLYTKEPPGSLFPYGLYSTKQYQAFKGNIGGSVTPQDLENGIARIRAATNYEMANYLIPTPSDFNMGSTGGGGQKSDSFGFISGQPTRNLGDVTEYTTHVYAPLYTNEHNDVLWKEAGPVVATIFDFMSAQESSIRKYISSLNEAARAINKMKEAMTVGATGSADAYTKAAKGISDIDVENLNLNVETANPKSCKSLAGQFLYFYYGHQNMGGAQAMTDVSTCPTSLGKMITDYFASSGADPQYYPGHYVFKYYLKNGQGSEILSAYMPGPFTGVQQSGLLRPPFPGLEPEMMRRNFYSTKFVTLDSLQSGKIGYDQGKTNFVIYAEGDLSASGQERSQNSFLNALTPDADLSSVKY